MGSRQELTLRFISNQQKEDSMDAMGLRRKLTTMKWCRPSMTLLGGNAEAGRKQSVRVNCKQQTTNKQTSKQTTKPKDLTVHYIT